MAIVSSINNSSYLNTSLSTDLTADGVKVILTANEAHTFGDAVILGASSEAYLADASAIATSRVMAVCISSSVSADAKGQYLLMGIARDDSWNWSAPGVPIYLSLTGTIGATLTETAPSASSEAVVIVGIALSATLMLVNPNSAIVEIA